MSDTATRNGAEANLEAALCLLGGLRRRGLRHLVLCPGSRSAPLAVAAGLLAKHGLQLHTGIDERSAAFFALGLSRATGRPAAVVTTSGTAVANLLPAVVEADTGAIPLLLLTADRPARLKGCGANQTVNQEEFLAPCCRWFAQADLRELAARDPAGPEALAARAWQEATGLPAGPVHLNLPFEEPLHASAASLLRQAAALSTPPPPPEPAPDRAEADPTGAEPTVAEPAGEDLDLERPGVVVAGPWRGHPAELMAFAEALTELQRRTGWPVLADGLSALRGSPALELVCSYDLILQDPPAELSPPQVLRLGPMPASRRLQDWLAATAGFQLLISERDPRNLDPLGTASRRFSGGLVRWWQGRAAASTLGPAVPGRQLTEPWLAAERRCQGALDRALPARGAPSEPALARALSRLLPAGVPLMLASSSPVRDWESFAASELHRPVYGFRGASGIDGTLSLAAGLASGLGQLVLLSGDLALLHDSNGWLWWRQLAGRLTVVLIDNGGGGIFEQLPIRPHEDGASLDFDRLFAMPQRLDHQALAAAHGVPSRCVERLEDLAVALHWALEQPVALLRVCTDRGADAVLRRRLRSGAARQP